VQRAQLALAAWKEQLKDAVKHRKETPPKPVDADVPADFIEPRLFVSDATIERLGQLLQVRPSGMLLVIDELAALFGNMARYSGGHDAPFWLQTWDGKPYPVERVGRPSLRLPHLLIGICGGLQADKVRDIFQGPRDGMSARFLFAWPQPAPYRRLSDDADEIDPSIVVLFSKLSRLPRPFDSREARIPLTTKARRTFERFRKEVYATKDDLDGREREWCMKSLAQVLRLAGTLAFLRLNYNDDKSPTVPRDIRSEDIAAAVVLVRDYFWPHARACLRLIGVSERHADARRVLNWLSKNQLEFVSREQIRRDALSQKLDAEETQRLIDKLAHAGWLRKHEQRSGRQGRPSIRWELNPALWARAIS
jgi:hypothetical protein